MGGHAKLYREEGASAKTAERPRFQEMLRYYKEATPRPSYVVVYAVDLFARDSNDHHVVKRHLASVGVLLRSTQPPETFRRLLENPIYTGVLNVEGWQDEHVASFDPLVDRDTFNRVQHMLKGLRPHVIPNQRNHPDFPPERSCVVRRVASP